MAGYPGPLQGGYPGQPSSSSSSSHPMPLRYSCHWRLWLSRLQHGGTWPNPGKYLQGLATPWATAMTCCCPGHPHPQAANVTSGATVTQGGGSGGGGLALRQGLIGLLGPFQEHSDALPVSLWSLAWYGPSQLQPGPWHMDCCSSPAVTAREDGRRYLFH